MVSPIFISGPTNVAASLGQGEGNAPSIAPSHSQPNGKTEGEFFAVLSQRQQDGKGSASISAGSAGIITAEVDGAANSDGDGGSSLPDIAASLLPQLPLELLAGLLPSLGEGKAQAGGAPGDGALLSLNVPPGQTPWAALAQYIGLTDGANAAVAGPAGAAGPVRAARLALGQGLGQGQGQGHGQGQGQALGAQFGLQLPPAVLSALGLGPSAERLGQLGSDQLAQGAQMAIGKVGEIVSEVASKLLARLDSTNAGEGIEGLGGVAIRVAGAQPGTGYLGEVKLPVGGALAAGLGGAVLGLLPQGEGEIAAIEGLVPADGGKRGTRVSTLNLLGKGSAPYAGALAGLNGGSAPAAAGDTKLGLSPGAANPIEIAGFVEVEQGGKHARRIAIADGELSDYRSRPLLKGERGARAQRADLSELGLSAATGAAQSQTFTPSQGTNMQSLASGFGAGAGHSPAGWASMVGGMPPPANGNHGSGAGFQSQPGMSLAEALAGRDSAGSLDGIVDRLVSARENKSATEAMLAVQHRDFGLIDLRFRQDGFGRLAVELAAADPELARALNVASQSDAGGNRGQPDQNSAQQNRARYGEGGFSDGAHDGAAQHNFSGASGQGGDGEQRSDMRLSRSPGAPDDGADGSQPRPGSGSRGNIYA